MNFNISTFIVQTTPLHLNLIYFNFVLNTDSPSSFIVYYVPRQSSRCLYEDAEFNVRAEGEDGNSLHLIVNSCFCCQ